MYFCPLDNEYDNHTNRDKGDGCYHKYVFVSVLIDDHLSAGRDRKK